MTERLKWEITAGSLINLLAIVGGIAIGWGVLNERAQNTREGLDTLTATLAQEANFRRESLNALESRIRVLEAAQARADERYSSLLQILTRIEVRLERMEGEP